jgi:hypothetical protein
VEFFGPVTVRSSSRTDNNVHCAVCTYNFLYFDLFYFVYDNVCCSVNCGNFRNHRSAKFAVILSVDTSNKADIRSPKITEKKGEHE